MEQRRSLSGARPDSMRSRSRMSLIRRIKRSVLLEAMRSRFWAFASTLPKMSSRKQAERSANTG